MSLRDRGMVKFVGPGASPVMYRDDDLYLLRSSCGWFKIGRSSNVSSRLRDIQMTCPPSVTIVHVCTWSCQGGYEGAVHKLLAKYRVRGEWFSADAAQLLDRLVESGLQEALPDAEPKHSPERRPGRGRRIYARGPRLWCRVKVGASWASKPTPFDVGQEDEAAQYAVRIQRGIDARLRRR